MSIWLFIRYNTSHIQDMWTVNVFLTTYSLLLRFEYWWIIFDVQSFEGKPHCLTFFKQMQKITVYGKTCIWCICIFQIHFKTDFFKSVHCWISTFYFKGSIRSYKNELRSSHFTKMVRKQIKICFIKF